MRYLLISLWEHIPEKDEVLKNVMEIIKLAGMYAWSHYDVAGQAKDKKMIFSCIFVKKAENEKFNIVIVHSQADFDVSDEFSLLKVTKNFGIFYGQENTRIVFKPGKIQESQLNSLLYFLEMTAYQYVANSVGITLEYPKSLSRK